MKVIGPFKFVGAKFYCIFDFFCFTLFLQERALLLQNSETLMGGEVIQDQLQRLLSRQSQVFLSFKINFKDYSIDKRRYFCLSR